MKSPLYCPYCNLSTRGETIIMRVALFVLGFCAMEIWRGGQQALAVLTALGAIIGTIGFVSAGREHRERCGKNGGLG